jgi:two-component system chemotaxis response regulator CheB
MAIQMGSLLRDTVVIGASAGGVAALSKLLKGLPADFQAALLIVLHISPTYDSRLANILGRQTALPVSAAEDGQQIQRGHIYVARPGIHLMVEGRRMRLVDGPRINWHKPAVDPLFISAAEQYGPRTIGIVLTGGQSCGTAGLIEIKRRGGISIVQDPADADHPQMPRSAIREAEVDYCLPVGDMASLLTRLVGQPVKRAG